MYYKKTFQKFILPRNCNNASISVFVKYQVEIVISCVIATEGASNPILWCNLAHLTQIYTKTKQRYTKTDTNINKYIMCFCNWGVQVIPYCSPTMWAESTNIQIYGYTDIQL